MLKDISAACPHVLTMLSPSPQISLLLPFMEELNQSSIFFIVSGH